MLAYVTCPNGQTCRVRLNYDQMMEFVATTGYRVRIPACVCEKGGDCEQHPKMPRERPRKAA
jgi:hypothetical protein